MANEGMGMAGGFAEAAGGVMSGFQYARQQQALEQQRKQQELQDAENRADSKMKRELLMKEIQNKEKAREIYAMDPVKDFGLDAKSFANRDLYEAELSKHYAAEFRKAGLGEEAVKHESVGGQFYEQGVKKVTKSAFAKALSGRVKEAQADLTKIGFNVGEIKQVKGKDGSMSFEIYDKVEGKVGKQLISTLNAAELAGVMGDEDAMIDYLMKKDTEISKVHAELEAKVQLEQKLKANKLGQYAEQPAGPSQNAEERFMGAHPFVNDKGQTISDKDQEITLAFLRGGYSLQSINKMRQREGITPIQLAANLNKEKRESLEKEFRGLGDDSFEANEDQLQKGADSYRVAKSEIEGNFLRQPSTPKNDDPKGMGAATQNQTTGSSETGMGATAQSQTTGSPELPQGWQTKDEYDKAESEKKEKDRINKNNESRNWKSRRKPAVAFDMKADWSKASTGDQVE
jgi:hypothetical protein